MRIMIYVTLNSNLRSAATLSTLNTRRWLQQPLLLCTLVFIAFLIIGIDREQQDVCSAYQSPQRLKQFYNDNVINIHQNVIPRINFGNNFASTISGVDEPYDTTGGTNISTNIENSINMDHNPDAVATTIIAHTEPSLYTVLSTSSSSVSPIIVPTKVPTIWSSRNELFNMIRPNNIPGIILFHMLGVYLVVVQATKAITTHGINGMVVPNYWLILLKEPVLWLTLLSTNLVSATSMVVNDYYDAKLGRDTLKQQVQQNQNQSTVTTITNEKWILHPINGLWNKLVTRRLLMYMYTIALCISNCLPGIPTRLSVTIALMMTYLYTVHLKPITFIKNVVCATLIALAPWTSGSCTLYLLQQPKYNIHIPIGNNHMNALYGVWAIPSLWRLFGVLFTGILGREILMDCTDRDADRASGIRTIPVVYGCPTASKVAAVSSLVMTYLAIISPLQQLMHIPSSVTIWRTSPFRRLLLSSLACIIQLIGTWKVVRTNGTDRVVIDKMINQNLFTVVLLMASFV